jgi:putative transposase
VLAVIEHASRRIRILGATPHPTTSWVAQAAKNLVMDLEDAGSRARFLIRDRDGKFPGLFDAVLKDAGIETVLSGVQMPRMNAVMERWVQTCRRELLDRTLIWNQRYLLHALREFEQFYNSHRPHQGIADARPLHALPCLANPRARRCHPPSRPQAGPPRRHPPRVPACRLTCTDEIFGKHRAEQARLAEGGQPGTRPAARTRRARQCPAQSPGASCASPLRCCPWRAGQLAKSHPLPPSPRNRRMKSLIVRAGRRGDLAGERGGIGRPVRRCAGHRVCGHPQGTA